MGLRHRKRLRLKRHCVSSRWYYIGLAAIAVALVLWNSPFATGGVSAQLPRFSSISETLDSAIDRLPLRPHPLPELLQQVELDGDDYSDRLESTPVGALVWSSFPVRVYVDADAPAEWRTAVESVINEWGAYLPLSLALDAETANITIWRRNPPPRRENGDIRAASARTTYRLFWDDRTLRHRFSILVSPTQVGEYVKSAVRHELGHALGIWGHSDVETDVMYFSQVRRPASISPRDVQTLRRVYERSTRLGWSIEE
ncbi:hypothetical protein [Baaleninema simplex]|uniref:hypothetical protein n=1 Tax=Baaleninema simplex TaxID=2862350 RepID=UPI00034D98EF|nr:hypothetical protein [Baaleninema simplex]